MTGRNFETFFDGNIQTEISKLPLQQENRFLISKDAEIDMQYVLVERRFLYTETWYHVFSRGNL